MAGGTASFFGAILDPYTQRARLYPALIAVFPVLLTAVTWYRPLYGLLTAGVGAIAAFGLFYFVADLARNLGRRAQEILIARWGAMPTTMWLRRRDTHLDTYTKERYYAFLVGHVPNGWSAPTAEQELQNPEDADARYRAAATWLLEYTRDKTRFPLVFKENVNYGFRRNLYGLKPFAIALALGACLFTVIGLYCIGTDEPKASVILQLCSLGVSVAFLFVFSLFVTVDWVTDAAHGYARALLAACDALVA